VAERGEVIFLGGTAFSGSDVVARLLAAHPGVIAVSIPAGLHSDPRGIPALLAGRIGLEDFTAALRRVWTAGGGEGGGGAAEDGLEERIARFRDAYAHDPLAACRDLFWALAGDGDGGARALVEASRGNLREAQMLARLLPEARFVHVVRDGRDVAAALSEPGSRPRRARADLGVWADELREIERGVRGEEDGVPYAIPDDRFALVVLDDLLSADGEREYGALTEALGLPTDPAVRSAAMRELASGAVERGRWRRHARGPAAWLLSRRYQRLLAELEREGNHAAPPLIRVHDRFG
jgi:hypothetical protein